jgi:2-phosphoglycerate kinase
VLLLGGTTAVGKSTSARLLATKLGIGCISGDSLWRGILAMTTAETHPVLHEWPRPDDPPGKADYLVALHIREAETLTPAMEAFLDHEMMERNRFVFHAAWITPDLAARKTQTEGVRAAFIDEKDTEPLLASIVKRSGRTEPSYRQEVMTEVGRLYGDWLREGAERLGLPIVQSRPHDTLVDRILEMAAQGGTTK